MYTFIIADTLIESDSIKEGIELLTDLLVVINKLTGGYTKLSKALTTLGGLNGGSSTFGTLGAVSGLVMNRFGIGKCRIVNAPLFA